MRSQARRASAAGAVLASALLALSCGGSDSATMPSSPPMAAASVDLAGTWTGTFQAYTAGCSSPMTATLTQNGNSVTGIVAADGCKIRGAFLGTLSGTQLSGKVEMTGCKGGAVLGTASASAVSLSIGDFLSLSDFGDKVLLYGGEVSLRK
jgi:hypothetical protein